MSNIDEILKYKQLLDGGAITQEEFNKKKKELLGDIIEPSIVKEENDNNAIKTNHMNEKKSKNKSLTIVGWIIGILMIISGYGSIMSKNIICGILAILIGLIIMPILNNILEMKFKWKLPMSLRMTICIVLFVIYSFNVSYPM